MTTQQVMLTEIQADTGRTAAAQVTAMQSKIAAAIRHYQPTRFWFNETDAVTFSTVAGTDFYPFSTIGTTFYKIDAVFVTFAAGDTREMDVVDWTDLLADGEDTTDTNQPCEYAYGNRGLRFYPNPDAAYTVRIVGHYKLEGPVDTSTDNDWMTHAYDLIMCRAKAELYAHRWEDAGNAQIMIQAEASALKSLQDATADKVRTGHVTPSSDF